MSKSKDKWAIYIRNERAVVDIIKEWLRKQRIEHFTEHNGFRTNVAIDVAALSTEIAEATGFTLKIEKESNGVSDQPQVGNKENVEC